MKIVTYKHDDIMTLVNLIDRLEFSGFEKARILARIGDIIDSGKESETPPDTEREEGVDR